MTTVSKDEANLISWFVGQVNLIESINGKKISKLELTYDSAGETGVSLEYAETKEEVKA